MNIPLLENYPYCRAYVRNIMFFRSLKRSNDTLTGYEDFAKNTLSDEKVFEILEVKSIQEIIEMEKFMSRKKD